jgi:predicted phosphodiesterase
MRLALVSDLHMTLDPAASAAWHNPYDFAGLPGRIDAVGAVSRRAGVDAVVACGDLTHRGDEASARAVLERLSAQLDCPVMVVAGNHDLLERDDQLERCLNGKGELLPATGLEAVGVRLAGVPIERHPELRASRWTGTGELAGEGQVSVVASHFPVISRAGRLAELGLACPRGLANRRALHERLLGGGPVVVLSGHLHARESHAEDNILQLSAGALVEAPYELAIVDVRAEGAAVRVRRCVHELGPPPAGPDPVLAPADEAWSFSPAAGWRVAHAAAPG